MSDQNPAIRKVPVKIGDDEVAAHADSLVAAMTEKEGIEADKKAAMTTFNERIEASETRIQELKHAIENREELRSVECLMEPDYKNAEMLFLHPKTREVLGKRPLEAEEYQTTLADVGKNRTPAAPAVDHPAGVCRYCKCTGDNPCDLGGDPAQICGWLTDAVPATTVCSKPACIKAYEDETLAPDNVTPIAAAAPAGKKRRGRPPGSGKKGGKGGRPAAS